MSPNDSEESSSRGLSSCGSFLGVKGTGPDPLRVLQGQVQGATGFEGQEPVPLTHWVEVGGRDCPTTGIAPAQMAQFLMGDSPLRRKCAIAWMAHFRDRGQSLLPPDPHFDVEESSIDSPLWLSA